MRFQMLVLAALLCFMGCKKDPHVASLLVVHAIPAVPHPQLEDMNRAKEMIVGYRGKGRDHEITKSVILFLKGVGVHAFAEYSWIIGSFDKITSEQLYKIEAHPDITVILANTEVKQE